MYKEWLKKEFPTQLSHDNIIEQIKCEVSIKHNRDLCIGIDKTDNICITIPSKLTNINWAPGCGERVEKLATISFDKLVIGGYEYDKDQGYEKIVDKIEQLLEEYFMVVL